MKNQELQSLVENISNSYFGKSFKHQASFNSRLRTTGGRYLLKSHNLEFNPKQLEYYGLDEFEAIIKHELCHYHLHLERKGYQHKDQDFKTLLNKVGGSRYCRLVPGTRNKLTIKYLYRCSDCGTQYPRKKRIDTKRYVCGKCKGKLELSKQARNSEV